MECTPGATSPGTGFRLVATVQTKGNKSGRGQPHSKTQATATDLTNARRSWSAAVFCRFLECRRSTTSCRSLAGSGSPYVGAYNNQLRSPPCIGAYNYECYRQVTKRFWKFDLGSRGL